MSETDSEQETEVFFKSPIRADEDQHKTLDTDQHGSQFIRNRVNLSEPSVLRHTSPSASHNTQKPISNLDIAEGVQSMVEMQTHMTSVLQNVAEVLTSLNKQSMRNSSSHHHEETTINNNNDSYNIEKTYRSRPITSSEDHQDVLVPAIPVVPEIPVDCNSSRPPLISRNQTNRQNTLDTPTYPVSRDDFYQHGNNASNRSQPRRHRDYNRSNRNDNIKIPPFNGKEDWGVWINRFEVIAERQGWTQENKLDELLPKLQGSAGDFVFTQLGRDILYNYEALVNELDCRFRVIETAKTFAAQFSRRNQKPNETAEEYASELKRLYDKAHRGRDYRTRQEDLVRRFLDGLKDDDVRCDVEYVKDPSNIDEAVYHVVNYIHTRQNHGHHPYNERKMKKFVRSAKSTESEESDSEDDEYVCQIRSKPRGKGEGQAKGQVKADKPKMEEPVKETSTEDILKSILLKTTEWTQNKSSGKQGRSCFNCQQTGHFARECPLRTQNSYRGNQNYNNFYPQTDNQTQQQYFNGNWQSRSGAQVSSENGLNNQEIGSSIRRQLIRRRKPFCEGIYIKGSVEGTNIIFTTDTGATRTVLSEKMYNRIPEERRPNLTKTECLTGAGGIPLKELGKAVFHIQVGPVVLDKELIVADIEDESLLGIDILQDDEYGPADIMLSKGKIILRGEDIPCIQIGSGNSVRRVSVAKKVVIPPQNEVHIGLFVAGKGSGELCRNSNFIIEPTQPFRDTYPPQMASVSADINQSVPSKLRVSHPFPSSVTINQDSVKASAERVDSMQNTMAEEESPELRTDNMFIRRVNTDKAPISKEAKQPASELENCTTPHEITGFTPNLLNIGREVRMPAELVFGSVTQTGVEDITSYSEYVDTLRSKMQHAHEIARDHLGKASKRNKSIYDVKMVHHNYKVGDAVWILYEGVKVGVNRKLERSYDGPYLIKRNLNNINFEVQLDKTGKVKVVHHDKIKLYEGIKPPTWISRTRAKWEKE